MIQSYAYKYNNGSPLKPYAYIYSYTKYLILIFG